MSPTTSRHGKKVVHKTRAGAYLHLWGSYWRYWRNSRFRALPDWRFRSVYACDEGGPHFHIGRNRPAS